MATKKIKILTSGSIVFKTGYKDSVSTRIWGPVLTPYDESVENIFKLLAGGTHIVEVCDDGEEVKLTIQNYQDDNSKTARLAREQKTVKKSNKKEEKVVEEPVETVADTTADEYEKAVQVEEAVDVTTDYPRYNQQNNKHNNNNNKNRH